MIPIIEISINEGKKILMNPYQNGMFESEINLTKGKNIYTVYNNSEQVKTAEINVDNECVAYVRYFPFASKIKSKINSNDGSFIFDSVNNHDVFINDATWVGELEAFSSVYLKNTVENWNPFNEYAKLNYHGGGIFSKKFIISQTLTSPYVLPYKIIFNKDWNNTLDYGEGNNILMKIPTGTYSFVIYANSITREVSDSINAKPVMLNSNTEIPAYFMNICLTGNFNNWEIGDKKYKFKQISKNMYAYIALFDAGEYSYMYSLDNKNTNGKVKKFTVKQKTSVIFLYSTLNNKFYDSVNNYQRVIALLGFKSDLTPKELDELAYLGDDLGANYTPEKTTFKVWAPTANRVQIKRYENALDNEDDMNILEITDMEPTEENVWVLTIDGDLKNTYYNYIITISDNSFETVDIYAKATGVNGNRGMVVDLLSTNPTGWKNDKRIRCKNNTDAIIWETHIKEFSILENSGISKNNRGKYLAFTEKNSTLNNDGFNKTCTNYLKNLGITHVHLLPAFDSASIDETKDNIEDYNWGYDPKNYNVPEGSFSSNPYDANVRINEFKQMVKALHEENIGVILDVVYNHTFLTQSSFFNLTVPGYYYRKVNGCFANGSGCGNETASERIMFRKYIIDSVLYWINEYHIDGIRLDLMGLHDIETINLLRQELDKLQDGKEILIYGEPWTALDASPDEGIWLCSKNNTHLLNKRVAVFNDNIRNAISGNIPHTVHYKGFIHGEPAQRDAVKNGIMAQNINLGDDRYTFWANGPSQVVNYVSVHDNLTLYDKLVVSQKNGEGYEKRYDDLIDMIKLSAALVITSQGIPFWQAGEEFARTKFGDHNSYCSSALINALNWNRTLEYKDLLDYYKGLIKIRKNFNAFTNCGNDTLNSIYFTKNTNENVIAYTIKNSTKNQTQFNGMLALVFNSNKFNVNVELQSNEKLPESFTIIANKYQSGLKSLGVINGNNVSIEGTSAMILVDTKLYSNLSNTLK